MIAESVLGVGFTGRETMASAEVLDFEKLLAAIAGPNPAGTALRDDFSPGALYHVIKDARAAARAAERTVLWDDPASETRPDWGPVLELAPRVLAEESKDLEIAAWLIEALVRQHGFAGLRDGFRLARGLVEEFWDQLYPLPDEEGMLTRVAPLTGLNGDDAEGTLVRPILAVPITAAGSTRPLSAADHRQAMDLEQVGDPDKRSQRIAQGAVSMQVFQSAVAETPPEVIRELLDDLNQCMEEFETLGRVLHDKCGEDAHGYALAPPSSNIRGALETCAEVIKSIVQTLPDASDGETSSNGRAVAAAGDDRSAAPGNRGQTREDAFRALLQVAEFFKRTEPHSPLSYALEQAVRWGRMPLPELLAELIPEDAARDHLFKLVGIRPPETN
jgi:type VI secretion system protein ImpA